MVSNMVEPASGNREALRVRQLAGVRQLLSVVLDGNRFYRSKLEGISARLVDLPRLEEFQRLVPLTSKRELVEDQARHGPFGTNLSFPIKAYARYHQTSGTSGWPLRWLDTRDDWEWLLEQWAEVFRAAGVDSDDRAYFAFSFGPFLGFWMAFEAAERLGLLCIPGGGLSSVARLRAILDAQVTVLCCTPTYALHLAEVARRESLPLSESRVRLVVVAGEPGGSIPATRARLEAEWPGARVFDHHGMTEVGPVTYECPARPGRLHVIETGYFAEIIDPQTGRGVDEGQRGELVLTPLGRKGSPLLRYRTGDMVLPRFPPEALNAQVCECGRSELALEGGIIGRVDDMVIVRGVNVFPAAVEEIIRRFPEIAEFQVSIRDAEGMTELVIRVEPSPDCADLGGVVRRLDRALREALSLRIPVVAVPPETLPRFELKARRWLRESASARGTGSSDKDQAR